MLYLGWVWMVIAGVIGATLLLCGVLTLLSHRNTNKQATAGGSGKVVGIVGRMGSGKSYMAVRMAHKRLMAGANVCTNFSMNLPPELQANWREFRGWDDFATLENAVVIIDEAQLYAPSNKTLQFPTVARWKLAQARKFGLDVYWISQHKDRINSVLRDLTHMIYVCQAFAGGRYFNAYGYEPEMLGRTGRGVKGQHIDRVSYKLDVNIANLYDTLQILDADDHLVAKDASMQAAQEIGRKYNERRGITALPMKRPLASRTRRCRHEIDSNEGIGTCATCPAG